MLEIGVLIASAALCVIAYQLIRVRTTLEEQGRVASAVRAQQEVDQEILHACPSLFYAMKPDLREFFAIHRRKRDHYERHQHIADVVNPHSDEVSSWYDIYMRLFEAGTDAQKPLLVAIAEDTDKFLHDVRDATVLTTAEGNFLAFQGWRELLGDGGDEKILGILRDHLQQRFRSHIENHGRLPTSPAG
jgi:hypothetical protein